MVFALSGRETLHCPAVTITQQESRADEEQRRAALGYLVWPAALYEQFVEREPASTWYRLQIAQAVRFGIRSTAIGIAALVWPLIVSLLVGSLTFTLVAYVIALVLDAALFVLWLRHALRYSKRAARGETFALESILSASTRRVAAKR